MKDGWAEALPGDLLIAKGKVDAVGWTYNPSLNVSTKTVLANEQKPDVDCIIMRPRETRQR